MASVIQFLASHSVVILSVLLAVSECAAAVVQMAFPSNQGLSGFLASAIKFLQQLGAKPPTTPAS